MVYRLSWLAGVIGAALALLRLNVLVQNSAEGAPWQIVVIAAGLLGGVITWTGLAYRIATPLLAVINLAALFVTAVRIAAPDTTVFLLPTADTFDVLRANLEVAFDLIRSGSAPVIPAAGLVVVITAAFWVLGALLVWGLHRGRPFVALTPPLIFYLQLATADRSRTTLLWLAALVGLIAFALAAVTFDERSTTTGRLTRTRAPAAGGVISARSAGTVVSAVAVALVATALVATAAPVSPTGVLPWRERTGLGGDVFGGIAINPFTSIHTSVISRSNVPVFSATVEGDIDPRSVYWRLLSLDTFNGTYWHLDDDRTVTVPDEEFEKGDHRFAGAQSRLVQDVTIDRLRNQWLPSAYATQAFESESRPLELAIRAADDGALFCRGCRAHRGMNYRVESLVPDPDLGALALGPDGLPTDVFFDAVANGAVSLPDELPPALDPPGGERFTTVDVDVDPRIGQLARAIVRGRDSAYEQGLALEAYLRNPDEGFVYDTNVPVGQGVDTVGEWLFGEDESLRRRGYCEQYATTMGLMARLVGIPSRVVIGFAPGRVLEDGRIVVLDSNAHAWVELWMPTQGWVHFDPTPRGDGINPATWAGLDASLPYDIAPLLELADPVFPEFTGGNFPPPELFIEPEVPILTPPPVPEETPTDQPLRLPAWLGNFVVIILLAVIVGGALPVLKWRRRRRRLRRLEEGDITAAWEEIVARLSDLGEPPHPAMTPLEYAESADVAMRPLASVYSEVVYGPTRNVSRFRTRQAADSFTLTEANIPLRYSSAQRLFSWYRLASVARLRRNGNGRRR